MRLDRYRSVVSDWSAFERAAAAPEPTVFRVRVGRVAEATLLDRLDAQGFRTAPIEGLAGFHRVTREPRPLSSTLEHWNGFLYVQQASTGVAAPALAPRPGERVLDLCAAPGGKTAHMAELMEDRGCLVASEISESRVRGLLGNVYRLGHTNVLAVAGDGREFPGGARFDRVLVDAPCSGEGTLRRRSGRVPRPSRSFLGYVTGAQRALLRRAIALTRPGGTILYVTCTFAPEENEAVVSEILATEPVSLEPLELGVPHAPGLTRFEEARYDPRVEGAARIYPHHLDSGGLFLARLRRLPGEADAPDEDWRAVPAAFPEPADGADQGAERGGPSGDGGGAPSGRVQDVSSTGTVEAEALIGRGLEDLRARYGVSTDALDTLGWTVRGGRVWAHTIRSWPLSAWEDGPWRALSVGVRALEFDSRGLVRPTNDFLRMLSTSIHDRVVDVDQPALARLARGGALSTDEALRGPVALRHRGEVLGRGALTRDGLKSEIPKARARDLLRVLEG